MDPPTLKLRRGEEGAGSRARWTDNGGQWTVGSRAGTVAAEPHGGRWLAERARWAVVRGEHGGRWALFRTPAFRLHPLASCRHGGGFNYRLIKHARSGVRALPTEKRKCTGRLV